MERHGTDRISGKADSIAATLDTQPTGEIPEDVAILYSWANLQGAKYRDFSASRREYRAQMRRNAAQSKHDPEPQVAADSAAPQAERAQADDCALQNNLNTQYVETETAEAPASTTAQDRREQHEEHEAQEIAASLLPAAPPALPAHFSAPYAPYASQAVAERDYFERPGTPAVDLPMSPLQPQREVVERATGSHLAHLAADPNANPARAGLETASQGFAPDQLTSLRAAARASVQEMRQQKIENRIRENRRMMAPAIPSAASPAAPYPAAATPYAAVADPNPRVARVTADELPLPPRSGSPAEPPRAAGPLRPPAAVPVQAAFAPPVPPAPVRPAPSRPPAAPPLLSTAGRSTAGRSTAGRSPADTLLASRERLASRWYALKGILQQPELDVVADLYPHPQSEVRTAVLAVFSLAGGVGKTTLVATLGRALSFLGEQVLLADTTSHGLLPFYFGASELIPGMVRHFSPPPGSEDAPIHMVSYNVDRRGEVQTRDDRRNDDEGAQDKLIADLLRDSRSSQRVLLDLPATSSWVVRRVARMNPTVLIPLAPDMNSVITLHALNQFLQSIQNADGHPLSPFYVLNQFDPALPLHIDVREVLRQQLGDRLLPFVIHRCPAVSEALAEGMTVLDYDPTSAAAADYRNLAAWVRESTALAHAGLRHVRWSER
jgi:cellulose synthase operon protein YhjQ